MSYPSVGDNLRNSHDSWFVFYKVSCMPFLYSLRVGSALLNTYSAVGSISRRVYPVLRFSHGADLYTPP